MATRLYGAVDIGGTKIAVGLVTAEGTVVSAGECATEGPEAGLEWMVDRLRGTVAIGVGCTGPVDPGTGRIGDVALLPGWKGFDLVERLSGRFGVLVCLENDCDAAALGEATYGAGRGCTRFLYVTVSTGIGAGFIVNGEIYRGAGGAHPEMGHQAIDPAGPECYCGARGCWESLGSGAAVASWYGEGCSSEEVFRRAAAGEERAGEAVGRFARYLSIGLGNLITFLAPDGIAVGGGVMAGGGAWLEGAAERAQRATGMIPQRPGLIRRAELGREGGLIGAARAAQMRYEGK